MQENRVPKYQKIQQDIIEKIYQEIYKPSSKLPSENQMAELYQTSVPTVRKALQELVEQKMIYRVKGSGTYVSSLETLREPQEEVFGKAASVQTVCFLVFTDISDSSIMKMIRGAQTYLYTRGYSMSILCRSAGTKMEQNLIWSCYNSGVAGIIYFAEAPEASAESFRMLREYGIPAVLLDRGPKDSPCTLVAAYNLDGGYQMAQHLLRLGHEKIAFAAQRMELEAEKERFRGYQMALREAGVAEEPEFFAEWGKSEEEKQRLTELALKRKITAIQCVNDKVAAEVISRLQKEGVRIPEEISVGGFDNWDETCYVTPRITTIIQPFEEMGRTAAEKLVAILKGNKNHSQTFLPVKLEIKDSTCPPNTGARH